MQVAAAPPAAEAARRRTRPATNKPAADERPARRIRSRPAKTPVPGRHQVRPGRLAVTTGKHVFGTTPLTLKLRPGNSYEFTFSKAGYAPLSRKFRFDGEEPQTLRVTLKKTAVDAHKPAAPAPPPKPAAPPPAPPKKGFFTR